MDLMVLLNRYVSSKLNSKKGENVEILEDEVGRTDT